MLHNAKYYFACWLDVHVCAKDPRGETLVRVSGSGLERRGGGDVREGSSPLKPPLSACASGGAGV